MSKSVTELWNVAHEVGQTCDMHTGLERRLADAIDALQKRGLLDLLDLVATLAPERIGSLKEWLNEKPICPTCCHRGHAPDCEDATLMADNGTEESQS